MSPVDRRRRIEYLLYELCAQFGFCLPREAREAIAAGPPADPDAFAAAVCRAEGFDPTDGDPTLHRQVLAVIDRTLSSPGYRDA